MTIRQKFSALFHELEKYQSHVGTYMRLPRIHADLQECLNEIDQFVKDGKFLLDYLMRNYEDSRLETYAETIEILGTHFSTYKDIAILRLLNYNPDNQDSYNEITIAHEDDLKLFYPQLQKLYLNESFEKLQKIHFMTEITTKLRYKDSIPVCPKGVALGPVSRPIIKYYSVYPHQAAERSSILYEAIRSVQEQRIMTLSEEFNAMDDKRRELCDEYLEAIRNGLKKINVHVDEDMEIGDIYHLYRKNNIAHPVKARALKHEYDRVQKSVEAKSVEMDALKNEHRRFLLDNKQLRMEPPPAPKRMEFEFCLDSSDRPRLK